MYCGRVHILEVLIHCNIICTLLIYVADNLGLVPTARCTMIYGTSTHIHFPTIGGSYYMHVSLISMNAITKLWLDS